MTSVLIGTEDADLDAAIRDALRPGGWTAISSSGWPDILARTARGGTRLVLLDGSLPDADGDLIRSVAETCEHPPSIWCIRGALGHIERAGLADVPRLAQAATEPRFTAYEKALLPLAGLGPKGLEVLQGIADNPMPTRLSGERGTGKEWLARVAHRLGGGGPFVIVKPGDEPVIRGTEPGTLYLEALHDHRPADVRETLVLARATGWRVLAGSRRDPPAGTSRLAMTTVTIRPLRERPKELRGLVRLYLAQYQQRLGLRRLRVSRRLWALLERYSWPGNQRELETWVVQAVTSVRGATLDPDTLPAPVLALLDREARLQAETHAFEAMVEERLRPVVARARPGDAPALHALVIDATERAVLRLVLARTGGNVKAGAQLLGLARNTVRAKVARLDPYGEMS